jgi:integrase
MKRKLKGGYTRLKTKLGLPDLEHAKVAVIVSLRSFESQRSYRHSIDEFVAWYCSAPRLSFNKAVVLRYRLHLEDRHLAAGTINVRLAAVRRLAYEAADSGLLSPDLAAGIRRVKGAKKLGCRLGNWLTPEEARTLWQLPDPATLKGKRDRAILALLLGCGLRRRELTELMVDHFQRREDHWAIVDLIGKGGHVRTVPVPSWVNRTVDEWLAASSVARVRIRCESKRWNRTCPCYTRNSFQRTDIQLDLVCDRQPAAAIVSRSLFEESGASNARSALETVNWEEPQPTQIKSFGNIATPELSRFLRPPRWMIISEENSN